MIISMPDVWDKAKPKHKAYVAKVITDAQAPGAPTPLTSPFLISLLKSDGENLAIGDPTKLEAVIYKVEAWSKTVTPADSAIFMKEAKRVFDYHNFSAKSEKSWNAYELCKTATHRLCPYCQQAYAFTFVAWGKNKKGNKVKRGFRPTLDHFFPKSKFPYVGLSLYNLVPACQTCNSSLKARKDFYVERHLHPLRDQESLRFDLDPKSYLNYRRDSSANLEWNVAGVIPALTKESAASIETFLLNDRFYEDCSVKQRHSRWHLKVTSDRSAHAVRLQS